MNPSFLSTSELLHEVALLRARIAELERAELERREAEQALRESRSRMRTVVSNVPMVLFALDNQGRFTLSEGKALSALGLKPGEVVGRSVFEMYADNPQVIAECTRALAGETFTTQVELPQAIFETRYTPLVDASGNAAGSVGVAIDVTERVRTERALRESEQRFRMLADNLPGVVYLCRNDERFTMTYMNDATESLTGYAKEDFLHDRIAFATIIHPDDLPRVYREVNEAVTRRQPYHLVYRLRRKDGAEIWAEERGAGVFHDHQLAYLEGYIIDITEQKRTQDALSDAKESLERTIAERTAALRDSEERFRQLAENIEEVFWLEEVNGDNLTVIYVSPAYERIWGRTRQSLYNDSKSWLYAIHPEDRDIVTRDFYAKVLKGDFSNEYRIIRPDGTIRWILDRGYPVKDASGKVYRICGLAEDITPMRQAEDRARRTQEELAHVLRVATAGELASGMAHELNQPLAAIANYASGCERRLESGSIDTAALREAIGRIVAQAERAGNILRNLRRFITRQSMALVSCDLNELVSESIELAEPDLRRYRTTVQVELAPDLPRVSADAVQIEQVILNLIRNACEAMEGHDEPHRITIRTWRTPGDGVSFSLSDTGPGIPPQIISRAFEPFVTSKPTGMGMGLSISRSIVEAHSGQISCDPGGGGKGAQFQFTLPAAEAGASPVANP